MGKNLDIASEVLAKFKDDDGTEFSAPKLAHDNIRLRRIVEIYEGALEFYAGETKAAEWDREVFLTYDKFGGLAEEMAGPVKAKQALESGRKIAEGKE